MKFSNILFAVFGLSTFVAALPAPAPLPAADTAIDLEKRDLIEREPLSALTERWGSCANLVVHVQVCIDAVVKINKKYSEKGSYKRGNCKAWAREIIAKIKILIAVIVAHPKGCVYPPIDVCVAIFVKLFVAIFVQLKVFIDIGGLIGIITLTVDLLHGALHVLVAELLHIVVTLFVLIEAKIQVGICAAIFKGCGGLIEKIYIDVLIKLCLQVGIKI